MHDGAVDGTDLAETGAQAMSEWWARLRRPLDTDPRGVGCEAALGVVHVYVDLLSVGIDAPTRYPGAAEHYVACDSCSQILQGIVSAVRDRAVSSPEF